MSELTVLEREIVQTLTRHIARSEEVSLTELAEECHVAKSTVVKAVKKLGYGGFSDLVRNVRFDARVGGGLLPRRCVLDGDAHAASIFATVLLGCRGKHNVFFSGDRRLGDLLSRYLCRKLAMFGIFASASYDYLMLNDHGMEPGIVCFFFHKELPEHAGFGQQEGYGEGMFAAAREAGYQTVVFSDDSREIQEKADHLIRLCPSVSDGCDLFISRVLMVAEMAFEYLSIRINA